MKKMLFGKCKFGKSVLAGENIDKNEIIIEFTGPIMKRIDLSELINPEDDRYLQIEKNKYLGPSGDFDDYFNHSCSPNSGIKIIKEKILLIAIKDIKYKQEITWDYSTMMDENDWEMDCLCGSLNCRGIIRDFKYLSKDVQQKYIDLEIVPFFIIDGLKKQKLRKYRSF